MPYEKKLSSLHVLNLIEQMLPVGRIEIPRSGDDWIVSPGFYRIFAIDAGQPSHPMTALLNALAPGDRPAFLNCIDLMREGITPAQQVFRVPRSIGTDRYLSMQFEALGNNSGYVQRFVGVMRDTTEEYHSSLAEKRYAFRLKSIMTILNIDCIMRSTKDLVLLEYFTAGGLRHTDFSCGMEWTKALLQPDGQSDVLEKIAISVSAGSPYAIPVRIRGGDGQIRAYVKKGFPIRDDQGRIGEWCGIFVEDTPSSLTIQHASTIADAIEHATGTTIRSARGALGWTYLQLAERSGLSSATIRRVESVPDRLASTFKRKTIEDILLTLIDAGIAFKTTNEQKLLIQYRP